MRPQVLRIAIARANQRTHGLLVAPEQNERVTTTVEPGPPSRIARADAVGFGEPLESLLRLAQVQTRQAALLIRPPLAGIFPDDRFRPGQCIVETSPPPPQPGVTRVTPQA